MKKLRKALLITRKIKPINSKDRRYLKRPGDNNIKNNQLKKDFKKYLGLEE